MSLNLPKDYQSQFFTGDVVSKVSNPSYQGKVLRAWAEEDGQHFESHHHDEADLNRPLRQGEVGVVNLANQTELRIHLESELVLKDRDFVKGDVIKRSLDQVESGVVMQVTTQVQLENCITGQVVADGQWVPMKKLASSLAMEPGDKVVYNNWLGTIKDVFEEGTIVSRDTGVAYKIAEMGGYLALGRSAEALYPPGQVPEAVVTMSPNPARDVVVDVRPVVVYVNWEVLNQMLPISEQDNFPKPQALWTGPELQKLTHLDMLHSAPPMVDTTAVFKDELDDSFYGLVPTRHVQNQVVVRAMRITACKSTVTVRWQDGHISQEAGTTIVPYTNVDEGDQGELRPSVVQTFDAHQRTAEVMFLDTKEKQLVSVLEIDTGGPDRSELGVRYGTLVLLCKDNGCPIPEVPSLGDVDDEVIIQMRTLEMSNLAERYAQNPNVYNTLLPAGSPSDIDWFGEVSELTLDGTVGVDVPSGIRKRVTINQVIMLNEGLPAINGEAMIGDGASDASMESQESWETVGNEDGEENDNEGSEEERDGSGDKIMTDAEDDEVDDVVGGGSSPETRYHAPLDSLVDDENWKSFDILEEAPMDHAYFKEPRLTASSKAFYSRLQKEHRALASSLPDNIIVRSYEDRTDLLRCLIIGPEGTPYVDAPFVFDVYLNPTKFPYEPPSVYFHSHTFGHGRCNPNLYEEGKVCLSILGTWQGDKSETWNPNKSSLLQVFVSISGLVLVRNPYHCEPAFAKLEGTREGKVNSRLYSEKAYVLSRSFVKTALEKPPTGLEKEIRWLYLTKQRLDRVISHATPLIQKAEATAKTGIAEESEEAAWNADAVGSLTTGAALTIKRTIASLTRIRDSSRS